MILKLLASLSFCLVLSACIFEKKEDVFAGKDYQKIDMRSSVDNPRVPSLLWEKIEEHYVKVNVVDEYSVQLDREKAKVDPPKKILDVQLQLVENTGNVLGGRNLILDFGSSGTIADLKEFIEKDTKGSFYLRFQIKPMPGEKDAKLKVFHLSAAKKLKIGDTVLGGGCNQLRDISGIFNEVNESGFLVSTIGSRHISLLSGTFVFVAVLNETLYFSSISLEDTRYPQFQCRR